MEEEDKGRKGVVFKVNEKEQASSSNNEDENDENQVMALVVQKFKKFYKKCSTKEGRNLNSRKDDKVPHSSRLAIEKEKGAFEAIKKKKKGKGLIGAWDQDSSESEGEEKTNMCFIALESDVKSSPYNFSNSIDNDDPNSVPIEIYDRTKICGKVLSLEKCTIAYDYLKKKVRDLTMCIEKFT
ncbi:hypothetical protein M9H77_18577 [Catharanthus roseus]|uniref:Uncharacterized protein n=1 Tax=Catharanthus roseus TaxID=4058 RepID=A0ACC0B7W7_CATRO|nr:hypothetical protein M9H77_18577 [Catharanthus roseus]